MDERDRRLAALGLGTMHATLVVLALVLAGHLSAAAPFDALSTWTGIAVFAWLWGLSVVLTHMGLARALAEGAALRHALVAGMTFGGVTGGLFVLGAAVAAAVLLRAPFLVLVGAIAGAFAAAVGGLVGVAMALLDVGLLALVDRRASGLTRGAR